MNVELLEREPYLAELNAALAEASRGTGRIVLVSGEAGIGKTTLVKEFTRRHQNKIRVLWGICDSLFTPRPLGPLHDMAAQMGGNLPERLASDADRTTIFSAVLSDLQARPVIVIFEDVHWADEGTLDLLRYLGRRIAQTSALLVITFRDDELALEHPLRLALGDLASSSGTQRILLPPFSEQAVHALVRESAIDAADLYRRTGGNPFFVTEVLDSRTPGIPATIRDAVLARAARLSPAGRAALEAAAVIGSRVELWLFEQVTGAQATATEECLAAGILLAEGNTLAFRHELARQTILDTLSPQRRLSLHRQVLAALAASPQAQHDLARLAHHAEALGDQEAVLEYAPAAARQASAEWAHRESAALYALALRFGDQLPPAEHAALLERYTRECNLTERQADGIEALRKALEIWRALGDIPRQGETLAFLAIMLRNHGDNEQAEQNSRTAIELLESLPPSQELAMAYRVQATLRLANRDIPEALSWGEKAIALAERFEAATTLATAHVAVGSALLFQDYERGSTYLEQQLVLGKKTWHERYIANLLAYLGSCSVELYRLGQAQEYLAEGIAFTSERGMDIFHRFMLAWMALAYLHLGRWDEAAELVSQTAQRPAISVFSRIPTMAAIGRLRARRGDPGAGQALDEALALATPTGSLPHLGLVRAARAEAAWLAGDRQRTFEEAQAVYDLAVSKRHPWFTGELAFWRWRAGAGVTPPDWTAAPFALQIAGDWRAAAHAWEQLGCLYARAGALADGDIPAKTAALEIYEQLGAQPNADALRGALRTAGIRNLPRKPHASTRDNPFELTNRQLDILALLVDDLSNAEIAARLHISPKTVDHHVSAVLAKLDTHSREEAAALARGHPHFHKNRESV